MDHSQARIFLALALVALSACPVACSDEPAATPVDDACGLPSTVPADVPERVDTSCEGVVPPSFAELQAGFLCHCTGCHASGLAGDARQGAPPNIDFDLHAPARAAAGLAVATVIQRIMPYPDGEGPTNAERNLFYAWALCGTPE